MHDLDDQGIILWIILGSYFKWVIGSIILGLFWVIVIVYSPNGKPVFAKTIGITQIMNTGNLLICQNAVFFCVRENMVFFIWKAVLFLIRKIVSFSNMCFSCTKCRVRICQLRDRGWGMVKPQKLGGTWKCSSRLYLNG